MPPAPASIIVPTYREAPNVKPLVDRIFQALAQARREAELILVDDDSQDGTEAVVKALQAQYPVRLLTRRHERGLGSAVLAGFAAARFDRFVVLDADLQHPPEMIPALLDRLDQGDCDFVIATRYTGDGGVSPRWPMRRKWLSRVAAFLARPVAPLSDPMSGFFALPRSTWERAAPLSPVGYKIALELFVKGRCRSPAEVPISFATREAGESKLNLAEQVRSMRHLYRLYGFRFPWLTRLALLLLGAGGAGILIVIVRSLRESR